MHVTQKEHYYAYISNSSKLHMAIFLQQQMTRLYTCLLIMLSCARHMLCRCAFLVIIVTDVSAV